MTKTEQSKRGLHLKGCVTFKGTLLAVIILFIISNTEWDQTKHDHICYITALLASSWWKVIEGTVGGVRIIVSHRLLLYEGA